MAGLLSLASFLVPFIDHVCLQEVSLFSISVFLTTVLLICLWCTKSLFFSVCLVQQGTLSQARTKYGGTYGGMSVNKDGLTWHLFLCLQPDVRVVTCRRDGKTQTAICSHFPQTPGMANFQLLPVVFGMLQPLGLAALSAAVYLPALLPLPAL